MGTKVPKALCDRCPLRNEPFVGSYGDPKARWIVVGEAPGAPEVIEGRPFVGQSGQLLAAAFSQAGADLEDSFLTNVVCCRPPNNRTPTDMEMACCKLRLDAELAETKNPILALGTTACKALEIDFDQKGAWLKAYNERDAKPAWHPAYVLRKPDEAPVFLAEVAAYIRGPKATRHFSPRVIVVHTTWELEGFLKVCEDDAWVAFDIETDQIQWYDTLTKKRDSILMLQLTWSEEFGIVIPDDLLYDHAEETARILNDFFARVRTVGHNAKFDALFLRSHLGINPQVKFDTLLAQYILDENMPRGLKKIVALEFGMPDYEQELIAGYLSSRNDRYSKVDFDALAKYGVLDVVCTLALREVFEKRLRENGQYDMPFMDIIMPASRTLEEVELRGFLVDEDKLNAASKGLAEQIESAAKTIRDMANKPDLNPNSTAQLSNLLYVDFKLPRPKSYKIKEGSTSAAALEELKGTHPVIEAIKEYRRAKKLLTSYVENVRGFRDREGRVHGNFLIYGTEVGRLAVRDPALQTIPRADDVYGGLIRGMYVAKPGHRLVICDYSQAELRVMACYSQEPFLLEAYRNDRDLHSEVAKAMYGPDYTKAQRVICKMFNFSYVYGGSEYSFAESSGLPVEVARQFVRSYNTNMLTALAWKKAQFERAQRDGYVGTIFGRRRHFPLIVPENYEEVRKSCVHMTIASTASDLTLLSLIYLEKAGVPVVLSVHDSILAEVPEDKAFEAGKLMRDVMVETGNKYLPYVPWKVDAEVRQSWYGGESYEFENGEWVKHDNP